MKKYIYYLSFLSLLLFCACRGQENRDIVEWESTGETEKEKQKEGNVQEPTKTDIPVSDKAAAISYEGSLHIEDMTASGNDIFLAGLNPESGKYEIHRMEMESAVSQPLPVEIPEGMKVDGMSVDGEGNLHFFMTDMDYSVNRCQMWVINREGSLLRQLDVRDALSVEGPRLEVIAGFALDGEGNYYISTARLSDRTQCGIILLNQDGKRLGLVTSQDMALWGRNAIARGNDGRVYLALTTAEDDISVISIDSKGLCVGERYRNMLPFGYGGCTRLAAGIGTDFFIYGADGIYACQIEQGKGKKLIDKSEFPVSEEGVDTFHFLADGRFLMIYGERPLRQVAVGGQEMTVPGEMSGNITFYYIPAASKLTEGE